MDRSAKLRAFFARFVAERGAARDGRIERAFAAVPREPFAGPPPWSLLPVGPVVRLASRPSHVETIACQGRQDEETGRGLAAAFARGAWQAVRSLRLDGEPDAMCWLRGECWWLSTG